MLIFAATLVQSLFDIEACALEICNKSQFPIQQHICLSHRWLPSIGKSMQSHIYNHNIIVFMKLASTISILLPWE
jgi:hypothetical protein